MRRGLGVRPRPWPLRFGRRFARAESIVPISDGSSLALCVCVVVWHEVVVALFAVPVARQLWFVSPGVPTDVLDLPALRLADLDCDADGVPDGPGIGVQKSAGPSLRRAAFARVGRGKNTAVSPSETEGVRL